MSELVTVTFSIMYAAYLANYQVSSKYYTLLYASAHLGAYYCMDIDFWYLGVYHMKQREHVVFFRNASKMQIVCMISILTLR